MTPRDEEIELLETVAEAARHFVGLLLIRNGNIDVPTAEKFETLLELARRQLDEHRATMAANLAHAPNLRTERLH